MDANQIEKLKALALAASKGPWRWELSHQNKSVSLTGGRPMFDKTVMDFTRWGMGGAAPRFNDAIASGEYNIMERVEKYGAKVPGREHHANWFMDVAHPDAQWIIAANPAAVLELIAEVERLTCELQNQREITQHWKASAGYVAAPAAGTVEKDAILEQAAAIADAERAEFMEQSCKNNGRESDFAFGSVNSAERIAASIRAIKSDAIAAHTKAGKANA